MSVFFVDFSDNQLESWFTLQSNRPARLHVRLIAPSTTPIGHPHINPRRLSALVISVGIPNKRKCRLYPLQDVADSSYNDVGRRWYRMTTEDHGYIRELCFTVVVTYFHCWFTGLSLLSFHGIVSSELHRYIQLRSVVIAMLRVNACIDGHIPLKNSNIQRRTWNWIRRTHHRWWKSQSTNSLPW